MGLLLRFLGLGAQRVVGLEEGDSHGRADGWGWLHIT